MRLALILTLIAAPAFARDTPPPEPTYEKPTFEKPVPPEPPKPPEEEPKKYTPVPQPVTYSCPKVKCSTDENGQRRVSFTADVQPDMYYLGRRFCESVPEDVVEVSACCLQNNGKYQILYNLAVPALSHKKAQAFCTCVLGAK